MNGLISHLTTAEFVQVIIESWNELLLLTMVFIISIGVSRDRRNELIGRSNIPMTSELLVFFVAVLFYDLSDMLFTIFQDTDTRYSSLILNISMYIYYVSGGFQTLFFLHVVKKNIAESGGDNRLKKMIIGFQALQIPCFLLLAITPLTGAIYHFNDENVYVRSWGFIVWQGVTIITFVFIGAVVILKWKSTESVVKQIILTATILPLLALSSSVVIDADRFHMNNIIIMITDLILFTMYERNKTIYTVKILSDLEKKNTHLTLNQLELEKSKNEVLMAQIQPHFINNSLMALRTNCQDYPEIYENITKFCTYLRSHFEALGSNKKISFEQEMENIEAYLYLEEQNFENGLDVEYDIECDDFYIPALTVQPLVENAVRHGVGTYSEGGTVWIKTHRLSEEQVVIEVIDDGTGRNNITSQQTKRKGIGIENVRARLRYDGTGELEIINTEHGTIARIILNYV